MVFRLCDSSYEFLNEPSDYTPSCTQSKQIVYDCHVCSYGSILLFTHVSSLVDLEFFLDLVWTNRARISYTLVDRFFMPLQTSRRMEFLSADAACMNV